ncbi:MAG: O-antigen ligase family protein [Planctomycetes bacterium]|nr:O-antigen ligase family protein [Planctomycetota bacterium]
MEFGKLFSYFLATLGVSMGWFNPYVGLMAYFALAILKPPFLWFWAFDQTNHPRFSLYVGLSTLLGLAIKGFGDWTPVRHVRITLFGLFVFLLTGVLTAQFTAIDHEVAWMWLDARLKIGLMAFVALLIVTDGRRIRTMAWIIVATMGFLAYTLNGWYKAGFVRRFIDEGFALIDNNGVALMMVLIIPLAFFMGVYDRRWWVKLLCFASVLLEIHVILFSYSRGGQLGLILIGATIFIIALFRLPNKMLTITVACLFVWATLYLAGPAVRARFMTIFADASERDASAASRFDTWAAAWACIKDHPWGVGPRNFNLVAHKYGLTDGKSVHGLFLQVGADHGIAGALGLALFYVGTMWQTFRAARRPFAKRLQWPAYLCNTVCISIAGFIWCGFFLSAEAVELSYLIAVLGLCTVAFVERQSAADEDVKAAVLPELEQVPGFGLPPDALNPGLST